MRLRSSVSERRGAQGALSSMQRLSLLEVGGQENFHRKFIGVCSNVPQAKTPELGSIESEARRVKVVDAGVIVAIISAASAIVVAALTALFSLRSYRNQKVVDREEELRKDRAKAYLGYLSAYAETEKWRGGGGVAKEGKEKEFGESLLNYNKSYSALFNIAVDPVIRPTCSFHEYVFVESHGDLPWEEWLGEWKHRHAAMLVAMRQDAFVQGTDITAEELAERLPWYRYAKITQYSQQEIPSGSSAETPTQDH